MKKISFICILTVTLFSAINTACGDKEADSANKLKEEVMALHQQDMVSWGRIVGMKASLKKKLEALNSADSLDNNLIEQKQSIEKAVLALEEADDAMKKWMNDYKSENPGEDAPVEDLLNFYQSQKEKMVGVGDMIHQSLEQATVLLNGEQ